MLEVGVNRGKSDSVLQDVAESVVHHTSNASDVAILLGTVDQLLIRQGHSGVGVDQKLALYLGGSSKGPASSAVPLIFDLGYSSFGSPIDIDGLRLIFWGSIGQ